jgi:hypothetical protein
MRFALALKPEDEATFNEKKLREIVLSARAEGGFQLSFLFSDGQQDEPTEPAVDSGAEVPEYVMIEETP